ncbi:hypothetical protein BKA93DRAFT_752470 [Sparassis latifolia]
MPRRGGVNAVATDTRKEAFLQNGYRRQRAPKQFILDNVLPKWAKVFGTPTDPGFSEVWTLLVIPAVNNRNRRKARQHIGRVEVVKFKVSTRKPRSTPAKSAFASTFELDDLAMQRRLDLGLPSQSFLKVRTEILDERWKALPPEEHPKYSEKAKQIDEEKAKRQSPASADDYAMLAKKMSAVVNTSIKEWQKHLPGWSVHLKMGGTFGVNGGLKSWEFDVPCFGGIKYRQFTDGDGTGRWKKFDDHFMSYLKHQHRISEGWTSDDAGNTMLPPYQKTWTYDDFLQRLLLYFERHWEHQTNTTTIPWDSIIEDPSAFLAIDLPADFIFKRPSDYSFPELIELYSHLSVAEQELLEAPVIFSNEAVRYTRRKGNAVSRTSVNTGRSLGPWTQGKRLRRVETSDESESDTEALEVKARNEEPGRSEDESESDTEAASEVKARNEEPGRSEAVPSRTQARHEDDSFAHVAPASVMLDVDDDLAEVGNGSYQGSDSSVTHFADAVDFPYMGMAEYSKRLDDGGSNRLATIEAESQSGRHRTPDDTLRVGDAGHIVESSVARSFLQQSDSETSANQRSTSESQTGIIGSNRKGGYSAVPSKVHSVEDERCSNNYPSSSSTSRPVTQEQAPANGPSCKCCDPFKPVWASGIIAVTGEDIKAMLPLADWLKAVIASVRNMDVPSNCGAFLTLPGMLSSEALPEMANEWVSKAQTYRTAHKKTPAGFRQQWVRWWLSLQPKSRRVQGSPGNIDLPHPAELHSTRWTELLKGGPNGIMLITRSLGFCFPARVSDSGMSVAQWHRWIYDNHIIVITCSINFTYIVALSQCNIVSKPIFAVAGAMEISLSPTQSVPLPVGIISSPPTASPSPMEDTQRTGVSLDTGVKGNKPKEMRRSRQALNKPTTAANTRYSMREVLDKRHINIRAAEANEKRNGLDYISPQTKEEELKREKNRKRR